MLELVPSVQARALEPFPGPVRTLEALHPASCAWLAGNGRKVALASFDRRMNTVARAMGFPLYQLEAARDR